MKKHYIAPCVERRHMAPLLKPLCFSVTVYNEEDDALTNRRSADDLEADEDEELSTQKDGWSEGLW